MNADQVCAMIDAITEGGNWTMLVGEPEGSYQDLLGIHAAPGFVMFDLGGGHRVKVTDPRVMQEIAGLLVAAAAKVPGKEGQQT